MGKHSGFEKSSWTVYVELVNSYAFMHLFMNLSTFIGYFMNDTLWVGSNGD